VICLPTIYHSLGERSNKVKTSVYFTVLASMLCANMRQKFHPALWLFLWLIYCLSTVESGICCMGKTEPKNAQMICASTRFRYYFFGGRITRFAPIGCVSCLFRVDEHHRTRVRDPPAGVTILEGHWQNFGHLARWGRRVEEDHTSDTL